MAAAVSIVVLLTLSFLVVRIAAGDTFVCSGKDDAYEAFEDFLTSRT